MAQWIECQPANQRVGAHAWVVGWVPGRGCTRGNHTLMFLFLSFSLPSPSLKINKIKKKKRLQGKSQWLLPPNSFTHSRPLLPYPVPLNHLAASLSSLLSTLAPQRQLEVAQRPLQLTFTWFRLFGPGWTNFVQGEDSSEDQLNKLLFFVSN